MNTIPNTNNILTEKLDSLKTYQSTLEQLNGQLNPILEQFQKAYMNYEMNPTNHEYERIFLIATSNMESLNSQLFSIKNALVKNIQILDQDLMQLNEKIKEVKKENQYLNNNYHQINSKQHGSIGMVYEFNDMYNRDYFTNLHVLIGILFSLYLTIQIFSDRTIANYNNIRV